MSGYLSIPVMAVIVLIQSTLMPEVSIAGGTPDLVLLVVLSWALMGGAQQGFVWAIVGGILQDIVSAAPLGTTSMALVVAVAGASFFLGRTGPRNALYPMLAAGPATFLAHVTAMLVMLVLGRPLPIGSLLLAVTLPTMIYNILVMFPVYRILGAFYLSGRPRRVEGIGY